MIDFNFKGIEINAVAEMVPMKYLDLADNKRKMRLDKSTRVCVDFWEYCIDRQNNLFELTTIQSILQFFSQSYWKRSSKEGSKIDLADVLHGESSGNDDLTLYFTARQKDKQHFLHICLRQEAETINEVYLTVREVSALEKAIGKAVSLLNPRMTDHDYDNVY